MAKCSFEVNVPQTVALKYSQGKPVESQYSGEQTLFTLTDGRAVYASVPLATKINALELVPGELFTVCYREIKGGRKEWQVSREEPEPQKATPAAPVAITQTLPSDRSTTQSITASPDAIPPRATLTAMMAGSLVAAIEALATAREFGKKHGFPALEFNEEDIRACAATIFIAYVKDAENRRQQYAQPGKVNGATWAQ